MLNMNRLRIFLIVILSSAYCTLVGQTLLIGNVNDENDKALSFVTIALFELRDSSFVSSCISDTLGNYKLMVTPGEYIIKYSLLGFKQHTVITKLTNLQVVYNIKMKSEEYKLAEVTITASQAPFSFANGGIAVNVQNSRLKEEARSIDIIKKIPGIISQGEEFEVLGKGSPAFYINGKEVHDFSEVEHLSVDIIQTIQLLTSPDALYASNQRAVILIKTKKNTEGLTFQVNINGILGRKFNHSDGLNLDYQHRGLHLFGLYKYTGTNTKEYGSTKQITKADTIWNILHERTGNESVSDHYFHTGINYDFNNNNEMGLKYTGKLSDNRTTDLDIMSVKSNNTPFAFLQSKNNVVTDYQSHHINIYYNTNLNKVCLLNWYSDYIHKTSKLQGNIDETDSSSGQEFISFHNRTLWNVWASDLRLSYNIPSKGSIILGYKLSYVTGNDQIQNKRILYSGETKNHEGKHSFYVLYSLPVGAFSLNAGLRYEYLRSKLNDLYSNSKAVSKSYSNLFPSVGLSFSINNWQQSLSYSSGISRPEFSLLNSNITYVNRFDHRKGNAGLLPALTNDINYNLFYKFIYLGISYNHTKNLISTGFYAEPENSSLMIEYPENFKHVNVLTGILNMQHTFKWWTPSTTFSCMKYYFRHTGLNNETAKAKVPIVMINCDNEVTLPYGVTASIDYRYCFGGDLMNIHVVPYSGLDIKLRKSFFKKTMRVYLEAYDIFNTNKNKATTHLNNISIDLNSNVDSRKIGLSIIYQFNKQSKKYKGDSAAQDELKRLLIDY